MVEGRSRAVSRPTQENSSASDGEHDAELGGEPVMRMARSPGKVEVQLKDLGALFDRTAPPSYPHTGPMVSKAVAKFLADSVREERRVSHIEVIVTLQGSPLGAAEEATARAQLHHFFANEAELADLDVRVNRIEGLGSLRFSIPLVLLAGLVAGLLYVQLGTIDASDLLVALAYLVFITIVWVLLWDPAEKLLFDSYFLRLQSRALRKLAAAKIVFVYASAPVPLPGRQLD
jgi:hypothetical protein